MGIALGLGAALSWGLADYFAAVASRQVGALRVVLYMHLAAMVPLTVLVPWDRGTGRRQPRPAWRAVRDRSSRLAVFLCVLRCPGDRADLGAQPDHLRVRRGHGSARGPHVSGEQLSGLQAVAVGVTIAGAVSSCLDFGAMAAGADRAALCAWLRACVVCDGAPGGLRVRGVVLRPSARLGGADLPGARVRDGVPGRPHPRRARRRSPSPITTAAGNHRAAGLSGAPAGTCASTSGSGTQPPRSSRRPQRRTRSCRSSWAYRCQANARPGHNRLGSDSSSLVAESWSGSPPSPHGARSRDLGRADRRRGSASLQSYPSLAPAASSEVAPLAVQQRTMSRIERMPRPLRRRPR